jgi:hypothetical protein
VTAQAVDVKQLFIVRPVPLGRIEVAVGGIVAPGIKIRVSGGLNFPGYHVASVTVVYLLGRR